MTEVGIVDHHLIVIKKFAEDLKVDYSHNSDYNQLINLWTKLTPLCEKIDSIADFYVYGYSSNYNSRHNGCRSMLKIISKFALLIKKELDNDIIGGKREEEEAINQVTIMLTQLVELMLICHESRDTIKTGKQATLSLFEGYVKTRPAFINCLKYYWGYYPAFWMDEDIKWLAQWFTAASSALSCQPFSLLSLVSRSAHGKWAANLFYKASPYFPLNLANLANNPLFISANWLSCKYSNLKVSELSIPRQSRWVIPNDGGKVSHQCNNNLNGLKSNQNDHTVSFRIISHANYPPNGNVIFHCQGGAFTVDIPAIYDQCFRLWIDKLKGTTIIDVNYTRLVRYPVMLQELLDVYLWLVNNNFNSEKSVKSLLGFQPTKIIFCGDSGGGLLLFSLLAILRDIQLTPTSFSSPIPDYLFPQSAVLFYPILSLTFPTAQPSGILAFLDQFLNPLAIFNCLAMYSSGVIYDSDCVNLGKLDSLYKKPSKWTAFYNTWFNRSKIWLDTDHETVMNRMSQILDSSLSPYKSPLISYDLELLKDVNISLIVGEFDPFIDSNLEFTEHWKGKVKVDIVKDLAHGFLAFSIASKKSRDAAQICLKRILEALDQAD